MVVIILFAVWIIPFSVVKWNLNPLDQMRNIYKRSFLIKGLKVGEIILFPVWVFPFPVLKINLNPLNHMRNIYKRCFLIKGLKVAEIILFPAWIFPFPVLKINMNSLDQMRNILYKSFQFLFGWFHFLFQKLILNPLDKIRSFLSEV